MKNRAYEKLTTEEKERMYSLARAGVSDDAIKKQFRVDQDNLLRVFDEIHVSLQQRRGYKGIFSYKSALRGDYDYSRR